MLIKIKRCISKIRFYILGKKKFNTFLNELLLKLVFTWLT